MAHNVFANEHIVMLANSFTRRRAMHINIAKVIFSVENTTLSLCFFLFFEYPIRVWGADLFLLGYRFVETPYLWEILLGR